MPVTQANLVTGAQTIANMQIGGPWTPTEWNSAVDRAYEALWIRVQSLMPTFRVTTASIVITTTATPSGVLPADFAEMLTVVKDANTPNRQPIPRYGDQFAANPFQRTWRLENDTFYIDPQEQSVGTYQIRYNPICTIPLVNMDAELAQFREFCELHAAIAALDAEESNSSTQRLRLYGAKDGDPQAVVARVDKWCTHQRSAEPSRVRDVRPRGTSYGPRSRWSIP